MWREVEEARSSVKTVWECRGGTDQHRSSVETSRGGTRTVWREAEEAQGQCGEIDEETRSKAGTVWKGT